MTKVDSTVDIVVAYEVEFVFSVAELVVIDNKSEVVLAAAFVS